MSGPTMIEQDVSFYWANNYSSQDVRNVGEVIFVDQTTGETFSADVYLMRDFSEWWDIDQDGWFDFGVRDGVGGREVFDGFQWSLLPPSFPVPEQDGWILG